MCPGEEGRGEEWEGGGGEEEVVMEERGGREGWMPSELSPGKLEDAELAEDSLWGNRICE